MSSPVSSLSATTEASSPKASSPKASRTNHSIDTPSPLEMATYLGAKTEFVPGDTTGKMETGFQADTDSLKWAAHGIGHAAKGIGHAVGQLF